MSIWPGTRAAPGNTTRVRTWVSRRGISLRRTGSAAPPRRAGSRPTGRAAALAIVAILACAPVATAAWCDRGAGEEPSPGAPAAPERRPHYEAARHPRDYAGPGREDPEPEGLQEVLLAWSGPSDPDHALGGDLWVAASLAVDEANQEGGYKGLPFRLTHVWSDNPWGNGAGEVARLVYRERPWAILGSIDGAVTHIAEQIAAKARLTLLSPVSTDPSVNMANVPWVFSCMPSDGGYAPALGDAVLEAAGGAPFVLLSATDHDSRSAAVEILGFLSRRGAAPRHRLEFLHGAAQAADLAARVASLGPSAVVILAGAEDSARIAAALRQAGFRGGILGGAPMGRRLFLEKAGPAAEGVVFPGLCDLAFTATPFARAFASRSGREPDCAAAQSYDAARLLISAVRKAGLNRARIRDAVQALSPWEGVAGPVEWDNLGQNVRPVRLATIRDGRALPIVPRATAP